MKHYILLLLLFVSGLPVYAQKSEADEKFRLFQYARAIPLYEQYLKKHPDDYDARQKIAQSCKLINDVPNAIEAYKKLVAMPQSVAADLPPLIQLLQMAQQVSEARQYANIFRQKQPGEQAENIVASLKSYDSLMSTRNDFTLQNKSRQYSFSVFTVMPWGNVLVITAEHAGDKSNKFTGRSYTDLYTTDLNFSSLQPFAESLMSEMDDGAPSFSDNGNSIYFTTVNKNSVHEGDVSTRKLQIVWAEGGAPNWKEPKQFPFNSDAYSTAHPTISKDGRLLVFSSDAPGGRGGMDLYLCRLENGVWAKPVNLSVLNTFGNEVFPVFQNATELIFASNGLPGLGGLDLYSTQWDGQKFTAAKNLGAPLNSSYDDFALISEDGLSSGYLSSNREGNTRIDNVFAFQKAVPATAVAAGSTGLKVKVSDKYTGIVLPYVTVIVKAADGSIYQKGMSDDHGLFILDELPEGSYTIQGELNNVTTTLAKVQPSEFGRGGGFIEKSITHNDPRFTLRGVVLNAVTNKPVEGAKVTCTNQGNGRAGTVTTQANGEFFFQLEQQSDFRVSGQKSGWLSSETSEATTKGLDRSKELYVTLKLNMQQPVVNVTIQLKKIFYAYDKCDIRPESARELDRLVQLMNDYPDMILALGSHTDSRGSDAYNLKLSQCRADAAAAYLRSKGISQSRFTATGYGETQLVNECANGVNCSDAKHEENRRTEFKIVKCGSCPAMMQ